MGTRTWESTGTWPTPDGAWHFYSVVIDRSNGPEILIDDTICDVAMTGFTLTPPSSGNWPADWVEATFNVGGRDAGTNVAYSGYAAGLYVIAGELDPERRSAHFEAISPAP